MRERERGEGEASLPLSLTHPSWGRKRSGGAWCVCPGYPLSLTEERACRIVRASHACLRG